MSKQSPELDLIDTAQHELDKLFAWNVVVAAPAREKGTPMCVHAGYHNISSLDALKLHFYSVYYEYHGRCPEWHEAELLEEMFDRVILGRNAAESAEMN